MTDFFESLGSPVVQGLAGGLVISIFNMIGALLVLVWRRPSPRLLNLGLGLAAGVMLTASFTSLILPGIAYGGMLPVLIGWGPGAALLAGAGPWSPPLHMFKGRGGAARGG